MSLSLTFEATWWPNKPMTRLVKSKVRVYFDIKKGIDSMAKGPHEVPFRSYQDLRTVAADFLAEYHPVGSIPVPSEEIVELKFDLDIIPIEGMLHGGDVYAFVSRDMTSISISNSRLAVFALKTRLF